MIGAGMAGILSVIELRRAGYTDFTVYEKADGFGGTWRENTLPRPRVRRAVAPLLVLLRAEPRLDAHVLGRQRDPRLLRAGRRRPRRRAATCASATRSSRCTFADGRWQIETASGHRDTADVVIAATGVLHHPNIPDIEGLDTFARRHVPQRALGPLGAARRRARRGDRHRLDRGADHRRARRAGSRHYCLFQRTAQWVLPQANNAVHRRGAGAVRVGPRAPAHDARQPRRGVRRVRQRGDRRRLAGHGDDRAARAARTSRRSRTRSCASGCGPTTAPAASGWSSRPTSTTRSRRRTPSSSTRRSSGSSPRACAPSTACCTSSTCSCSPPASTPTRSCARWRSPAATA